MIFEKNISPDLVPKKGNESLFQFYNRSTIPEIKNAKRKLEYLTSRYPLDAVAEIEKRITSKDDSAFQSVTFEMILHELFLRMGYEVFPHPDIQGIKPDFLIRGNYKKEFYIEAKCLVYKEDRSERYFIDELNKCPHSTFCISLRSLNIGKTQPKAKKVINDIHKILDGLTSEKKCEERFVVNFDGGSLTFKPVLLRFKHLVFAEHSIDSFQYSKKIRDDLKKKAKKYKNLDKPFLIAYNYNLLHLNRIDEEADLFGDDQFIYQQRETVKSFKAELLMAFGMKKKACHIKTRVEYGCLVL